MSLLSDTQGRPHTVRAVIRTIRSLGGTLSDSDLSRWFLPGMFQADESRVRQSLGCARSLGWVETEGHIHRLTDPQIPVGPSEFLDHLHATLCATDKVEDRRVLEAYSAVLLQMDSERSTGWLKEWTAVVFADFLDKALRGGSTEGERAFNKDKIPAWKEWLEAIGLGWNGQKDQVLKQFLPDPAPRLRRELQRLGAELGLDRELLPFDFLSALGRRMPYLDGGAILEDVSIRMKKSIPKGQVSVVLARALLYLEQDGVLTLVSSGDAAVPGFQVPTVDVWPAKFVVGVRLHGEQRS